MAYHTEFSANVKTFLGDYAVTVAGGMTSQAHGGGTVQQALYQAGFIIGGRKSEVDRIAVQLYAYFALVAPAPNTDKLPFSKDQVNVELGSDDGSGTGVPVYVIPYEGGRALGVQLPSQTTDGQAEAWAMTATQNGCTVEISGSRDRPYASHTNAFDAQAMARQGKINTRLNKLQQRFVADLHATYGPGPLPQGFDPTLNRTQFGFFHPNGVNPAHTFHGYQQHAGAVAGNLDAVTNNVGQTLKGGRVSTGPMTHTRYRFTPTAATVAQLQNPALPPMALVVGHRINNQWTFYFQEYATMYFEVQEIKKFGAKVRTSQGWIMSASGAGRKQVPAMVVLSHGELWPNVVAQNETFQ